MLEDDSFFASGFPLLLSEKQSYSLLILIFFYGVLLERRCDFFLGNIEVVLGVWIFAEVSSI